MQCEHSDKNKNEINDVHDTLAMAICMQLSEEFHHMMKRLNFSHHANMRPLTIDTYQYYQKHMFPFIIKDRRELNLYNHIVGTYAKYIEILKARKYETGTI